MRLFGRSENRQSEPPNPDEFVKQQAENVDQFENARAERRTHQIELINGLLASRKFKVFHDIGGMYSGENGYASIEDNTGWILNCYQALHEYYEPRGYTVKASVSKSVPGRFHNQRNWEDQSLDMPLSPERLDAIRAEYGRDPRKVEYRLSVSAAGK